MVENNPKGIVISNSIILTEKFELSLMHSTQYQFWRIPELHLREPQKEKSTAAFVGVFNNIEFVSLYVLINSTLPYKCIDFSLDPTPTYLYILELP